MSSKERNLTARMACRKRKIKCHMLNSRPPCTRCRNRKLACEVQVAKDDTVTEDGRKRWEESIEQRLSRIESTISESLVANGTEKPISEQPSSGVRQNITITAKTTNKEVVDDLSCSLGAFPASSIHNLSHDGPDRGRTNRYRNGRATTTVTPDDTLLASDVALAHFKFFRTELDPIIYGVLQENDTLQTVRQISLLLAVAICAFAAYCTTASDCRTWINRLQALVLKKTFTTDHTFDDVRAMCVGAFWLDELATALNAMSVRISSELNLHRCITKMPHTKDSCYERTRLYFLVYITDHRCSLTYGRPPMTRAIQHGITPRRFLESEYYVGQKGDMHLVAEFELSSLTARVFDTFGADIQRSSRSFLADIKQFENIYDEWLQDWLPVLSPLIHLTTPNTSHETLNEQGPNISQLAAKLYLFSHIFRGPRQRESHPPIEDTNHALLREIVSLAIRVADDLIEKIREISSEASVVETIPSYIGLMTAFASMVLHRTSQLDNRNLTDPAKSQLHNRHLKNLCSVLERSFVTSDSSLDEWPSTCKPLVKLLQSLRRRLHTSDTIMDTTETPGGPTISNPSQLQPDHMHWHSPDLFMNDNLFTADFPFPSLPFFDGSNLDSLAAENFAEIPDYV